MSSWMRFGAFGFLWGILLNMPCDGSERLYNHLDGAAANPKWKESLPPAQKLWLIRQNAKKDKEVSNPISDRYIITKLAGPVDLVDFLGLAINVMSGKKESDALLVEQWRREGGYVELAKDVHKKEPRATPDDLLSYALGAIFGREVIQKSGSPTYDVNLHLLEFFEKLRMVDDNVVDRLSYNQLVLGLENNASAAEIKERQRYYTAVPIYILPLVDKNLAATIPNAKAGLKAAGFYVRRIQNQPIVLEPIAAKKPQPTP